MHFSTATAAALLSAIALVSAYPSSEADLDGRSYTPLGNYQSHRSYIARRHALASPLGPKVKIFKDPNTITIPKGSGQNPSPPPSDQKASSPVTFKAPISNFVPTNPWNSWTSSPWGVGTTRNTVINNGVVQSSTFSSNGPGFVTNQMVNYRRSADAGSEPAYYAYLEARNAEAEDDFELYTRDAEPEAEFDFELYARDAESEADYDIELYTRNAEADADFDEGLWARDVHFDLYD